VGDETWVGPALVCPVCRHGAAAQRLDKALRCPNRECGEQFSRLKGTGIPEVLAPAVRQRALELDVAGALPAYGELGRWLRDVTPGSPPFAPVARAAIFLRAMIDGREGPFYADLCDALLPELSPDAACLDLGCGAGNLAFEIARRISATVIGQDFDAHLLRWGERAAASEEFEVPERVDAGRFSPVTMSIRRGFRSAPPRFICANLLDPPFEAGSFDCVTLVNVLDAVPYPAVALRQAVALLKPGGNLLFASPDSWNGGTTPIRRWLATTEAGWDRVFEGAGLETLRRIDDLEWRLQDTPRLHHLYRAHGRLLRKR
jgi:SAM-dependent methyltransferase